jgi:hypothetical protein
MRKQHFGLSAKDCPPNHILYVIMHGLICLVDEGPGGGFIAYLNDMGSEHKYFCGDFLAEKEIPVTGTGYAQYLELVNVAGNINGNTLDPSQNAVVNLPYAPESTANIRAAIGLPRPLDICHFIQGTLAPKAFAGNIKRLVKPPQTITGIRVFQYSFSDYHCVRLQDGPHNIIWECPKPVCIKDKDGNPLHIAVLHIYNEPLEEMPHPQAAEHNLREFNQTLSYLGAPDLQLKIPGHVITPSSTSPHPLLAVLPEEVSALDHRHAYIVSLIPHFRTLISQQQQIEDLAKVLLDLESQQINKQDGSAGLLPYLEPIKTLVCMAQAVLNPRGAGGGGAGGSQVCGGANGLVTG